jgi:transcriptional regulator with XRE-family HTH domain
MTQEELAEKASISTRYVQDLEAGFYSPTIFLANSLRIALECDWDDLLKGC